MTSDQGHSGVAMEVKIFCGYMLLCGSLFLVKPQMPAGGIFPKLEGEGFGIACFYVQVVGFQMMQALLAQCPGPRGIQMAMMAMIGGMAFHIFSLSVIPSPQLMVGVVLVFVTTIISGKTNMDKHDSKLSQYAFIVWNVVQGVVFITTRNSGTGTPLITDSYPDVASIEGALAATNVLCEVSAMMSLVLVFLQCPGALGRAMAMTATVALTGYHYSQDIMPPPPVVVLATVSAVASWMAYAAKKKAKSS